MCSLIEPDDKVLIPIFGRFGYLMAEIAERCGAEVFRMYANGAQSLTLTMSLRNKKGSA